MANGHGGARPNSGRPKGSANKRTQEIEEKLQGMKCDPIAGLARIAVMAEEDAQAAEDPAGRIPHMQLATNCYKELAQYIAPKRKAVEVSQDPENPIMTEDQIDARLASLAGLIAPVSGPKKRAARATRGKGKTTSGK